MVRGVCRQHVPVLLRKLRMAFRGRRLQQEEVKGGRVCGVERIDTALLGGDTALLVEHADGHEGIGRLLEDPLHLPEDEPAAGGAGRETVREPGQICDQFAEDHGVAGEQLRARLQQERGTGSQPGERRIGFPGILRRRREVRNGGYRGGMVPRHTGRDDQDRGQPQQVVRHG